MALDHEMQRWSGFVRALRKEDKLVFDQLMDVCRNFASAVSNATRPVLFEAMIMSVLLHQQKVLNKLEKMVVAVSKQSE
jgi:hypothetical protein